MEFGLRKIAFKLETALCKVNVCTIKCYFKNKNRTLDKNDNEILK